MPKVIINGTLDPVKQPVEYNFDPTRGLSRTDTWESAGDGLRALAAAYQALRVAYKFNPNGRKSVLVATASGPEAGATEVTTDTWQIMANEIQKDLRELPRFAVLDGAVIASINRGILAGTDIDGVTPALTGDARLLYDLLNRGSTHYALGQYVLRHTTNVSNTYNVNVSDFNIESIYLTSQLITEVTNQVSWVFPMPGRLVNKIQNLVPPTLKDNYRWGWRKLPSTETTSAGNRIEITTEYWLDQWSTIIYSTV